MAKGCLLFVFLSGFNIFVVCFVCFGKIAEVLKMLVFPVLGAFVGCLILVYLGLEGFRCFCVSCFYFLLFRFCAFFCFVSVLLLDCFWCCSCFCFGGFVQFLFLLILLVFVCFVCLCWCFCYFCFFVFLVVSFWFDFVLICVVCWIGPGVVTILFLWVCFVCVCFVFVCFMFVSVSYENHCFPCNSSVFGLFKKESLCFSFQFLVLAFWFLFCVLFVSRCSFVILFICLFSCFVLNHNIRFVFEVHLLLLLLACIALVFSIF